MMILIVFFKAVIEGENYVDFQTSSNQDFRNDVFFNYSSSPSINTPNSLMDASYLDNMPIHNSNTFSPTITTNEQHDSRNLIDPLNQNTQKPVISQEFSSLPRNNFFDNFYLDQEIVTNKANQSLNYGNDRLMPSSLPNQVSGNVHNNNSFRKQKSSLDFDEPTKNVIQQKEFRRPSKVRNDVNLKYSNNTSEKNSKNTV